MSSFRILLVLDESCRYILDGMQGANNVMFVDQLLLNPNPVA